jgi:hypothetical protein
MRRTCLTLVTFCIAIALCRFSVPVLYSIVCGSREVPVTSVHQHLLALLVPGVLLSSALAALAWALLAPSIGLPSRLLRFVSVVAVLALALIAARLALSHRSEALAPIGDQFGAGTQLPFYTVLFYVGYPGAIALGAALLVRQRG